VFRVKCIITEFFGAGKDNDLGPKVIALSGLRGVGGGRDDEAVGADGGWQAFGQMADHRCTKDAAVEKSRAEARPLQRGIWAGCSHSIQKQWRVTRKRRAVARENEELG